jgi:hypothetical protein
MKKMKTCYLYIVTSAALKKDQNCSYRKTSVSGPRVLLDLELIVCELDPVHLA